MRLVRPSLEHLPGYVAALRLGWSPDSMRRAAGGEELRRIEADPSRFLDEMDDRQGTGPPVTLPDLSLVPRPPGFRLWMWDGEFCGSIGLRWQPGTPALPPHCLGHIGYTVVPWKQNLGYATEALRQLLPLAQAEGLTSVDICTERDNVASRRVIKANGGVFVTEFTMPFTRGAEIGILYRIELGKPSG